MEKSLTFDKSINPVKSNSDTPFWYESVKNFDSGDFKTSFCNLLRYVNNTIQIPNESSEQIELNLPHGSIIINIKLNSITYEISAPFLKVPEGPNGLGMMRQISELNFSYLVLGQIVLKGNDFYLEYKDSLENSEPYKIYSILEEICFCADYYDDVFIDKFKTESVKKPVLDIFTSTEMELAFKKFEAIIKEGIELVNYLESKRFYSMACDILDTIFLKIDYLIAPQGILNAKLSEAKSELYAKVAIESAVANTKLKFQELLSFDKQKFSSSLFHPKFLIPIKKRGELPYIQEFMSNTHVSMTSSFGNKSYMNVSISALYLIYDLFYKNAIPNEVYDYLEANLEKAGGKDWQTSAEILFAAVSKIMNLNPEEEAGGKLTSDSSLGNVKSIFGKITGLFKK